MIINSDLTLRQKLSKNYINAIGWHTKHKYAVIESDDWGSIRMFSRAYYNNLLSKGVQVDKHLFDKNDAPEDGDDLSNLFEVLQSVKDKNGNHAVFTLFCVVANPNFEKLRLLTLQNITMRLHCRRTSIIMVLRIHIM